jgi:hypothetical protein
MFKLFYSNRNPIAMDVRLLIDKDGASSSHGPLTSSPPLFSLSTSNLSKLDDDDVVMFFKKFVTPPPPPKVCLMSTLLKKFYIL